MTISDLVLRYALGDAALEKSRQGALPHALLAPVAKSLQELSQWYVGQRGSSQELNAAQVRAYTLYYLLINAQKWDWLWHKALRALLPKAPLRVLDFGAGPGTAALALLNAGVPLAELLVIERSRHMREAAQALAGSAGCSAVTALAELPAPTDAQRESYDLLIFSNVLNELPAERRLQVLQQTREYLRPGGVMAIIEPALQVQTRELMQLRDRLLQPLPDLALRFPCVHQQACPMLRANARDWCHTTILAELPPLVQQLDELTGFNKHRLKLSCLVLQRAVASASPPNLYRMLEDSTRTRPGIEALVCGAAHYGKLIVPRKQRSEQTAAFEKGRSFDPLLLDHDEQGRVTRAQRWEDPLVP